MTLRVTYGRELLRGELSWSGMATAHVERRDVYAEGKDNKEITFFVDLGHDMDNSSLKITDYRSPPKFHCP